MSSDNDKITSHLATSAIIDRIKKASGLRFDVDIATPLRAEKKTVSVWKARNAIPIDKLIEYSRDEGVSLDWLINGRGPMRVTDMVAEPGAIYEVTTNQDSVYALAAMIYDALQEARMEISSKKFQDLLRILHRDLLANRASEMPYEKVVAMLRLLLPDK